MGFLYRSIDFSKISKHCIKNVWTAAVLNVVTVIEIIIEISVIIRIETIMIIAIITITTIEMIKIPLVKEITKILFLTGGLF